MAGSSTRIERMPTAAAILAQFGTTTSYLTGIAPGLVLVGAGNTIAAGATASFLVSHSPSRLLDVQAAVHGDVTAFAVIAGIFLFAQSPPEQYCQPVGPVSYDPPLTRPAELDVPGTLGGLEP
jgi:hypothetical protein